MKKQRRLDGEKAIKSNKIRTKRYGGIWQERKEIDKGEEVMNRTDKGRMEKERMKE